jgi:hypothetical protein
VALDAALKRRSSTVAKAFVPTCGAFHAPDSLAPPQCSKIPVTIDYFTDD